MEEKWRVNAEKLIDVAKRNLAEMRTMFENRHYYGTVNRTYYSMFHAVSALLILDGKPYKNTRALLLLLAVIMLKPNWCLRNMPSF
jgi:uncharacterized protein (UPF0332 family)